MDEHLSRRSALRLGSGALGTGVLGSLAGCTGSQSGSDATGTGTATRTQTETTPSTETEDAQRTYQPWLPEPAAVVDDGHYFFEYVDYSDLRDYEEILDPDMYDSYAAPFSEVDPSLDRVDSGIIIGPLSDGDTPSVVTGSFTADEVASRIGEFDYARVDDIGDYAVYMGEGAVAVRDGTLLFASEASTGPLETLIDTRAGEVTRYTQASDTMASLLGRFGNGTFVLGETYELVPPEEAAPSNGYFTGQVGTGYEFVVGSETTSVEVAYRFAEAGDIDMDAVSEFANGEVSDEYDTIATERQGRTVVITGEVPTGDFRS